MQIEMRYTQSLDDRLDVLTQKLFKFLRLFARDVLSNALILGAISGLFLMMLFTGNFSYRYDIWMISLFLFGIKSIVLCIMSLSREMQIAPIGTIIKAIIMIVGFVYCR